MRANPRLVSVWGREGKKQPPTPPPKKKKEKRHLAGFRRPNVLVLYRKCPQLCGNTLKHPANDTADVHSQFLEFFFSTRSRFFFGLFVLFFLGSVLCKCKSKRSPVKAPFPCSSGSLQLSGSTPPTPGLKRRAPSKSAFFVHLFFLRLGK